jgi:hypothetical protein
MRFTEPEQHSIDCEVMIDGWAEKGRRFLVLDLKR